MKQIIKAIALLSMLLIFLSSCTGQTSLSPQRTTTPFTPTTRPQPCQTKTISTPRPLTGHIAFAADGNDWDIFIMNADGSGRRQLTHDPGPQFDPAWSPDGKKIVYRDSRHGINKNDEIYVLSTDGS